MPCAEQKAIYASYAEISGTSGGAVEVRPAEQYW